MAQGYRRDEERRHERSRTDADAWRDRDDEDNWYGRSRGGDYSRGAYPRGGQYSQGESEYGQGDYGRRQQRQSFDEDRDYRSRGGSQYAYGDRTQRDLGQRYGDNRFGAGYGDDSDTRERYRQSYSQQSGQGGTLQPGQHFGQGMYGQSAYGQGAYTQGTFGQTGHGNYGRGGQDVQGQGMRGQSFTGEGFGGGGSFAGGYPQQQGGYGAYGSGYGSYGRADRDDGRNWVEKAGDEVSSWFGDDDARRRREWDQMRDQSQQSMHGQHRGRGPKGYQRSDDRIKEEVNERLSDDPYIDASEIEVQVKDGEVTLSGTVDQRHVRRRAEDIIENCSGVKHVQNNIRVKESSLQQSGQRAGTMGQSTSGQQADATSRSGRQQGGEGQDARTAH